MWAAEFPRIMYFQYTEEMHNAITEFQHFYKG